VRFLGHLVGGRTAVTLFAVVASLMFLPSVAGAYPGEGLSGPGFRIHRGSGSESDVNVCSFAVSPGAAHCDLRVRIDAGARSRLPARAGAAKPDVLGDEGAYDPSYLQSAYDVAAATAADGGGAGQTVAIIDSYNDPNVTSDLAHYRSYFGLPACPAGVVSHTATGCVFEKVNQTGGQTSFPSANSGWATEISLDVEMVSAICSKCQILLVEANSNSDENLGTAVNEAVKLGANAVSNSYGGEEFPSEASESAAYYDHPGVAITASAGDGGYGVEFPASSRYVTAVGGTSLTQLADTGTRDGSETVWSGTGSGCSAYEPKPSWQRDTGCANRTVADVSADANPATGVWVYDTYQARGWEIYGGTSVASPIIASFYALAGNALGSGTTPASYLYSAPGALYDVTSGSDGSCSPSYLCTAGVGYDGPTGLGTPGGSPDSLAAFLSTSTTQLPTAPGAPSNLVAKSGNAQVELSWAAPATGTPPFTYSVYESTTSATAGFSLVKSGSALANTSFTATGLTNGKTYYFKVTATNLLEEGPASSVASATPAAGPAVPGAPTGLSAASFFRTVYLSWKAPASNGGSPITSYVIFRATSSGEETQYGTVACTSTTCTARDTGASSSTTTYYYEVAAANVAGQGPRSNEASAKG
jgi:subtilase family serine protease